MKTLPILETNNMNTFEIKLDNVQINSCLELMDRMIDDNEVIHPIPSSEALKYGIDNLNYIMYSMGLYTFPTIELIDWLKEQITDDPDLYPDAIEIGAGTGWIGYHLEIPATDLKLQNRPDIKAYYETMKQPTIIYPDFVKQLSAVEAINEYQPEFVIGSYITHKYKQGSHKKGGNMYGVDTSWVINHCHKFFHIGNLNVHKNDPSMKRKHQELSFPWLITRGDISKARIFIWENKQWR